MIRLRRGAKPDILTRLAHTETNTLWTDYGAGRKLKIKGSIYRHKEVKKAVRKNQHNKCAYCETLNPRSHDVVEHYRPKGGWRQDPKDSLSTPQYFWLAYDWDNLLFCCDVCNDGSHKQNLFPLTSQSTRATAANPDLRSEKPLLINPYKENPSNFIVWSKDVPASRAGNAKGAKTIEIFKLDSDTDLIDARRSYLIGIEAIIIGIEDRPSHDPKRIKLAKILRKRLRTSSPYTAMIRANFKARIDAL